MERHQLAAIPTPIFHTGRYQQEILLPHFSTATPPPLATGSTPPTPAWGMHTQKLSPPLSQPQTSKQGSWGSAAIPLPAGEPTLLITGCQRCSAMELLLSMGRALRWEVWLANDWTGSTPNPQAKGCLSLGSGTIKDEARETWTCTVTLCIKLRSLMWIQIQL